MKGAATLQQDIVFLHPKWISRNMRLLCASLDPSECKHITETLVVAYKAPFWYIKSDSERQQG